MTTRSRFTLLLVATALLGGCAHTQAGQVTLRPRWWPREQHGGDSGRKAAPDVYFMAAGAAFDEGLQLAYVRPIVRFPMDVGAALAFRIWKPLGRTEGSHFLFTWGIGVKTIADMFAHKGHIR